MVLHGPEFSALCSGHPLGAGWQQLGAVGPVQVSTTFVFPEQPVRGPRPPGPSAPSVSAKGSPCALPWGKGGISPRGEKSDASEQRQGYRSSVYRSPVCKLQTVDLVFLKGTVLITSFYYS